MVIDETGQVYAWGSNRYGQIGNGESGDYRHEVVPTKVLDGMRIVSVDVGVYHALALTDEGQVYSWGSADPQE